MVSSIWETRKVFRFFALVSGYIYSIDDFLLTSAGLATTETTLFIHDHDAYYDTSHPQIVFEPLRVMTANRLAKTGKEWVETFQFMGHNW